MKKLVLTVFYVCGALVLSQLLYVALFDTSRGADSRSALVMSEQAVEKGMADNYDIYCYSVNAYKYADFTETNYGNQAVTGDRYTVHDIFERDCGVSWQVID